MRAAALALSLALAASPALAAGRVACAGGETMQGVAEAWAAGLRVRDPGLTVSVDRAARLAAEGFQRLLAGEADCVLFVREPFPSELAAFRARFGYAPALIPVAGGSFATRGGTHAIAIYVNAANPLKGLTLDQLAAVLSARGAVTTWGQLGLAGDWAERPIHLYGTLHRRPSGDPPGVLNFVRQRVLRGGELRDGIEELEDRPREQALQAIVRRVAEDPAGLGYSGFG